MMKYLVNLFTNVFITSLCFISFSIAEEIDPVMVSPDFYTIILENENVRVVEYLLPPDKKDNWHAHPPKVSYVIEGGKLKINLENGESFVVEEKPGQARWSGSVGKHFVENVGATAIKIVIVENKNMSASIDN